MTLSRRRFLTGAATALVSGGALLHSCDRSPGFFVHGIASGDPLANQVILWTRITLPDHTSLSTGLIRVRFEVSEHKDFKHLVTQGSAHTSQVQDFTVKVDVKGLAPATTYYYRFIYEGVSSPIGQTKTLPVGHVETLNIAFTSCAHLMHGYFNVYARIADMDDLDVVLHLGDYIYEYGNDHAYRNPFMLDRRHEPAWETVSLSDYRIRHAQYKRDSDTQKLHARHPMICVWDDHEIANNSWREGALNHDASEGDYRARADAAIQAYYEWMPIREPRGQRLRQNSAYRHFRFGDLINLAMLDTRLVGRDEQVPFDGREQDPQRCLLGKPQAQWLEQQLIQSKRDGVRWNLLGQQVQMMQLKALGQYVNSDSWDGYPAARNRLLDHIKQHGIDNVVVLTGDIHSSWAADISKDPYGDAPEVLAVELVTPSVSSSSIPIPGLQQLTGDAADIAFLENPHIQYVDIKNRGFVRLEINHQRLNAKWYHVPVVGIKHGAMFLNAEFNVNAGEAKLHKV